MQEEVNEKVIALCVNTLKMTGRALKTAMGRFLDWKKWKSGKPKNVVEGKQTLKKLQKQGVQLTNIRITDDNIKSFDRVARKYGIDYCLKKDVTAKPPKYYVFFKAKDIEVMKAAFKEYTGRTLKKQQKPSVRKKLQEKVVKLAKQVDRIRVRVKDRVKTR